MAMRLIYKYIHISMSSKIGIRRRKKPSKIFDEYLKSKPLAFLNQSLGLVYDDFAHDEDSHLYCLEPTQDCLEPIQHSWVLDPS